VGDREEGKGASSKPSQAIFSSPDFVFHYQSNQKNNNELT
jgi:hypothetical protein